MIRAWSSWKRLSDAGSGDIAEAPIGPGVYEVRHALTGRVIAFGPARDVARTLLAFNVNRGVSNRFVRFFRKEPRAPRAFDFEYRTFVAANHAEAKMAARRLHRLRGVARLQRVSARLATRRQS